MALPHYTNDKTSNSDGKRYEPVYPNLFEVSIIPPGGNNEELTMQHVTSVEGLVTTPEIAAVGQKYKFSDRSYAGMPDSTFMDITINFTLNLNDSNQLYLYKELKNWYLRVYDPATGEIGLKQDYVGKIIIVQHNRAGDVFRKVTCEDAFITGSLDLGGLDYGSAEPAALAAAFRVDSWTEELT